jgi:hypothetical protein
MSIDWSKAPYDAEAGYCGTSQAYDAWYRRDGAGQVQQMCPAAGYPDWTWMGGRKDFPVGAELRPAAESTWDGEGLPPVGTVCELWPKPSVDKTAVDHDRYKSQIGRKVKIVAHHDIGGDCIAAVFAGENDFVFEYHSMIEGNFRPIRTAEQIERDKGTSAWITQIEKEYGWDTAAECERILIDAGYRKQVQP